MKLNIEPFSKKFIAQEGAKAMALKPLEEAAEVFGAWQEYERDDSGLATHNLIYETLDCVQACVNLLESLEVNESTINAVYRNVYRRNDQRGRY